MTLIEVAQRVMGPVAAATIGARGELSANARIGLATRIGVPAESTAIHDRNTKTRRKRSGPGSKKRSANDTRSARHVIRRPSLLHMAISSACATSREATVIGPATIGARIETRETRGTRDGTTEEGRAGTKDKESDQNLGEKDEKIVMVRRRVRTVIDSVTSAHGKPGAAETTTASAEVGVTDHATTTAKIHRAMAAIDSARRENHSPSHGHVTIGSTRASVAPPIGVTAHPGVTTNGVTGSPRARADSRRRRTARSLSERNLVGRLDPAVGFAQATRAVRLGAGVTTSNQ